MKYAIYRTKDGQHYGKVLDEKGGALFETNTYKSRETVRQHLRRWLRLRQMMPKAEEE